MLTKLTLERFKNFEKAELILGPVTSLFFCTLGWG